MKLSGVMVSPPSSCAESGIRTLLTISCLPLHVPEYLVVPIIVKRTLSAIAFRKAWPLPLDNSANILRTSSLFSAAPMISPPIKFTEAATLQPIARLRLLATSRQSHRGALRGRTQQSAYRPRSEYRDIVYSRTLIRGQEQTRLGDI